MERRTNRVQPKKELPELPEGMTVDDLRFVSPHAYAISMAMLGWEAALLAHVDGNEAKVSYSLTRTIPDSLNLDELKRKIGIVDNEGNSAPGYYLGTTNSKDAEFAVSRKAGVPDDFTRSVHEIGNNPGPNDEELYLYFNFTGFPTKQTMDILMALENEFKPEDYQPVEMHLLASSESAERQSRRSILQRAREIFHI